MLKLNYRGNKQALIKIKQQGERKMLNETDTKRLRKWEEQEVEMQLSNLPFNMSLAGYSMLVEAILKSLRFENKSIKMSADIYTEIAQARNISVNSVEKAIRSAIDSVNNSQIKMKEVEEPSLLIKNALADARPKHFIMAMCRVIKLAKLKQGIEG